MIGRPQCFEVSCQRFYNKVYLRWDPSVVKVEKLQLEAGARGREEACAVAGLNTH